MDVLYNKYKTTTDNLASKGTSLFNSFRTIPHIDTNTPLDAFKPSQHQTFDHLENLYRDLDCPYHLLQASPKSKPFVPGLTPTGFVKWFTTSILAYPEQECRRLNMLLADLPPLVIIDAQGKQEVLPKTLPRHVFPKNPDKKTRHILDGALVVCLQDQNKASSRPVANISRPRPPVVTVESSRDRRRAEPSHRSTRCRSDEGRSSRHPPRSHQDEVNNLKRESLPPPVAGRQRSRKAVEDIKIERSGTRRGHDGWERERERHRDQSPRRRSSVVGGPTWDDYYRNSPRTRGSSSERGSRDNRGSR